ncbi:MAG: hypothetical protein ACP5JG_16460, partial [Anaerolineae bacterium]
ITQAVPRSATLIAARDAFLESVGSWMYACMERYGDADPTDVHDQGTYMTAWAPYIRFTGDARSLTFLKERRDRIRDHFVETDQWHHGYWRLQEAHHGTEHFELFLGALFALDPDDVMTQAQLLDAAEHIGNWIPGIPRWFDKKSGLFRSMYLGTETVRTEPGMELNIPDHLRYVNLCLLAHRMTKGWAHPERYLELAVEYAGRWADAVIAHEHLPIGLLPYGPVYQLDGEAEAAYRGFAGMAGHLDDDVDRAENLLASNGTGALLNLWKLTQDDRFLRAEERLLDVLAAQLLDPDAGAAADAIRRYRRRTGHRRYDAAVLQAVDTASREVDPFAIERLGIEPDLRRSERPHGIGKRSDMPNWFEDGKSRRHNPILLALAAEIRSDEALATRALDLAHTYFNLARATLPDGRHHGCAANTISAVARGHGRENHAGMVTTALGAMI